MNNMMAHRHLVLGKTGHMRKALRSLAVACFAALLLWTIGEPFAIEKFGKGLPWGVYALLFTRFALRMADALSNEAPVDKQPDGRPPIHPQREDQNVSPQRLRRRGDRLGVRGPP